MVFGFKTVTDVSGFGIRSGDTKCPVVKFENDLIYTVPPSSSEVSSGVASKLSRTQFPLKLAWALTIHKAQGMTLTRAELWIDDCFEYGQAYVALRYGNMVTLLNLSLHSARSPHS